MTILFEKIFDRLSKVNTWLAIGESIFKIFLIVLIAYLSIKIVQYSISKFFHIKSKTSLRLTKRREKTIAKLLKNMSAYIIYFIALINILLVLHINIGPFLAGAGILGLALGFGAQNLVKDILTGFFIIVEDQFSVGDSVKIGPFEGVVEEIGLRITKIKSSNGERHIIPNGSIIQITNQSIHNTIVTLDVPIPNECYTQEIENKIESALEKIEIQEILLAKPQFVGIYQITANETILRITAETKVAKQITARQLIHQQIKPILNKYVDFNPSFKKNHP